jgi:polyferredoxin
MSYDFYLLVPLAGFMAYVTARIVKWASGAQHSLEASFIVFILAMMAGMFGGAVFYLNDPGITSIEVAVWMNMGIMAVAGVPVFLMFIREAASRSQEPEQKPRPMGSRAVFGVSVISLVLLNEFLMGWAFLLAAPEQAAAHGGFSLLGSVIGSYWFLFTMAAEMALTAYFLRREIPRSLLAIVGSQAVIMSLTPTAISTNSWESISIYGGSSAMVVLFVFTFEYLYRNKEVNPDLGRYILRVFIAYSVMMTGLFLWMLTGNELLFDLGVLVEMAVYFDAILRFERFLGSLRKPWLLNPRWTFGLMLATLIAEFFMGGLIDLQYYGRGFMTAIPFATFQSNIFQTLGAGAYDFVLGFSTIANSLWFWVMMGAEMGSLVLFKFLHTRERELKIQLGLLMLTYALYTVYVPYILFSGGQLGKLPFFGWSMGIGSGGPFAPGLLGAIAITYLVIGSLSVLFGSRVLCSTICTAPLMYQGTFISSMSSFNMTSRLGRKLLTSRLGDFYKTTVTLVMASIAIASVISFLDSIGILNITLFGSDVTVFLYAFYFNFLWYIVFILTPYIGTYGCVTTGYCHWGLFSQLTGRLGFFKLKVKSTDVCVNCKTKDCAKSCPVGLTDMLSHFMTVGEFKSMKCIGCGDCVSACPYENIEFKDVRHWIKSKLERQDIKQKEIIFNS